MECLSPLRRHVDDHLTIGWSPEQIAGRLRLEGSEHRISHESIYRYIYRPKVRPKKLHRYLARAKATRGRRYFKRRREPIPGRRSIHDRGQTIDSRAEFGHWEGDTLVVDTVGFSPGFLAFRTAVVPHSNQMHSVEKFWFDGETEALIQSYVAEDPTFLNNAYTGQNLMQLSAVSYEPYNCVELSGDNNIRPE